MIKYSFVIIAYNEEKNIRSCIESILSQKDLYNYEVIVVDDGSKDKTKDIVKHIAHNNKNIKLISDGKNHGRGYSRYIGVLSSKGKFIAMIDADIKIPKNWLEKCNLYIKTYDAVGGIAVPDGDVSYVYRRFKLIPKVVPHST